MSTPLIDCVLLLADQQIGQTVEQAVNKATGVSMESIETALEVTNRFNVFSCISLFVGLIAIGAWFNAKVLKLPSAVGTMLFGILLAGILMGVGNLGIIDEDQITHFLCNLLQPFLFPQK